MAADSTSGPSPQIPIRKIPVSGEALPIFGLGTWSVFDVPEGPGRKTLAQVLGRFSTAGCTLVDTSPMYVLAEAALGEAAQAIGATDKLFLATKVWTEGRENGIAQMENSLRLLGRKSLDLIQVHNLLDWETHVPILKQWKAEGRIRYWGLTHYKSTAFAELERVATLTKPDFLQFNYSIADRDAEKRMLPFAADHGIAVLANRPFGKGEYFRRANNTAIPAWALESGLKTWSHFFMQYVISHPAVTCTIPATGNPDHMTANLLGSSELSLDLHVRTRMAQFFDEL